MREREAGFTLLETMVCVGIMMVVMGAAFVTQNADPASKDRTRSLLGRACDLARTASGANSPRDSGMLIVVRPAIDGSSLQFLRGRPIREYDAPHADSALAPFTTPATIALADGKTAFSIAFAPDGHVDVLPYAVEAGAAPIDGRPGCGTPDVDAAELLLHSPRGNATIWLQCGSGRITLNQTPS